MKISLQLVLALWLTCVGARAETAKKNWTAPTYKSVAQQLCDEIMAAHPEFLSVTLHGVPPGMSKVYTMIAGSYPDRIGNPDDPDDVMISELGITILDPRWHRTKDPVKKYVVMMPLRDKAKQNIGLIVIAYKNDAAHTKTEQEFFAAATILRDGLEENIPTYEALFKPASS